MTQTSPLNALQTGTWFKLICGASFQDLPAIRNFVLAYTLAGADCIDVAADPAVVRATQAAIAIATSSPHPHQGQPWLMVSLNDGVDPHFRKAVFDPAQCPADCPRPCERICPTGAIALPVGVKTEQCYGCGRCWPVCPLGLITPQAYVSAPTSVIPLVMNLGIDAIEIHTQVGNLTDFTRLWQALKPWVPQLQALAISCPDHPQLLTYLRQLYELIAPLPCALIWQTDGRPMSGDLGHGTTHAAIRLAHKVLKAGLPGYVQLAGGTNCYTVPKLVATGLRRQVAGVAYGSAARTHLKPVLQALAARSRDRLEDCPDLLQSAVAEARNFVLPLKQLAGENPTTPARSALTGAQTQLTLVGKHDTHQS